jgi:hypothetical protein
MLFQDYMSRVYCEEYMEMEHRARTPGGGQVISQWFFSCCMQHDVFFIVSDLYCFLMRFKQRREQLDVLCPYSFKQIHSQTMHIEFPVVLFVPQHSRQYVIY